MIPKLLPTYARSPLSFVSGEGCWIEEQGGRRYLDLAAGIAVNALGHCHPALVKALADQASTLWHTSNLYRVPMQEALAERLTAATFADTVFFTNSGTEACELAVKMARKLSDAQGRPERIDIIAFEGSFHGRSSAAIAAAGAKKLVEGFGPLLSGFTQIPYGDMAALAGATTPTTAAVMVEPILGEGGIVPLPDGVLKELRAYCDEHDLLLILDEVQCGMGRTGRLFACEWDGVMPDIMLIAKGIGGGFPLGAVLAREEAALGMTAGTHGSTYGGNPLACAVGCAVMDVISDPAFLSDVCTKGAAFRQRLEGLIAAHPGVFESVRGKGLMLGVKCVLPVGEVISAINDAGVLAVPASDNVIRLLPPLIISLDEIDEGISRLATAARALEGAAP